MENDKAKKCLRTFLEVSEIQIDERLRKVKRLEAKKSFFDSSKKSTVNSKILEIREETKQIQGRLDSVKLEMLAMVLENPTLISQKMLSKKGYNSYLDFVKDQKTIIESRELYRNYPYTVADVLNIGLNATQDDFSTSLFDCAQTEATEKDIKTAVDAKNVKIMTKRM